MSTSTTSRRAFSHHAECWYASELKDIFEGEHDHITIIARGAYEFRIAWIHPAPYALRVEVYDDAWRAFGEFADLFSWLSQAGEDRSPGAVAVALVNLGLADLTPRSEPTSERASVFNESLASVLAPDAHGGP